MSRSSLGRRVTRRCAEQGSISIVAMAGALVLCVSAAAVADLGSVLVARARAQAGADAAALAAVVQQVPAFATEEPEAAASKIAAANDVELVECRCPPGRHRAEVEVAVRPTIRTLGSWVGREVRAIGAAEVDEDLLSYRR